MDRFMKYLLPLLPQLLKGVTPKVREDIENWIKIMNTRAKETDNPLDNLAVFFIASIFGVEV